MTTVVAAARIDKNNGWGLERQQASAPYQAPNRCFYRGSVAEVIFFEALSFEFFFALCNILVYKYATNGTLFDYFEGP
jgi:hypothetical protein